MSKIRMGTYPIAKYSGRWIKAMPTGEFRCPRKGEWYLSGSVIEAYQAPNDLGMEYWIAKRVKVDEVETVVEILKY